MKCPKCASDSEPISNSHYVCRNTNCIDDQGNRTQFTVNYDTEIKFPYNQIFANRKANEFYRKPYLKIEMNGVRSLTK